MLGWLAKFNDRRGGLPKAFLVAFIFVASWMMFVGVWVVELSR